jgi:hypothetical protein
VFLKKIKEYNAFALQVDESMDIGRKAQHLAFALFTENKKKITGLKPR